MPAWTDLDMSSRSDSIPGGKLSARKVYGCNASPALFDLLNHRQIQFSLMVHDLADRRANTICIGRHCLQACRSEQFGLTLPDELDQLQLGYRAARATV